MKLKLELFRYGSLVFGKVLEQKEYPFDGMGHTLADKGRYSIKVHVSPNIVINEKQCILFVRGSDTSRNDLFFSHKFTDYSRELNEEIAIAFCEAIKELVDEINVDKSPIKSSSLIQVI